MCGTNRVPYIHEITVEHGSEVKGLISPANVLKKLNIPFGKARRANL